MDYALLLKLLCDGGAQTASLLKILNTELALPNIPTKTMGGEVFWNTIAEYNGWRLQQNMVTHHARILDADNVRIAWGTINGMKRAMERMASGLHTDEENAEEASKDRQNAMAELKSLKELLDIGAISEEEFHDKKAKILSRI